MLIIDFDGTIVDIYERYYTIFFEYWGLGHNFDKQSYIQCRRAFPSENAMIKKIIPDVSECTIESYKKFKKVRLEKPDYLKLDKVIVDADLLKAVIERCKCAIITLRRNPHDFFELLHWHGLGFLKQSCTVLAPKDAYTKMEWVQKHLAREELIVVGDSETDINIGRLKGSKVYFVQTGLGNEGYLKGLKIPFESRNNINECLHEIIDLK